LASVGTASGRLAGPPPRNKRRLLRCDAAKMPRFGGGGVGVVEIDRSCSNDSSKGSGSGSVVEADWPMVNQFLSVDGNKGKTEGGAIVRFGSQK
jgi:hypothetical protein